MSSIDNQELFEKYYQNEYDYDTKSLSDDEIYAIKKLVKEKRVDYSIAPMGTKVFEWILDQDSNLKFEFAAFESNKIDGLLYIPQNGKEKAYIVINSKKPLINQIFTAAHEFYHYISDYQSFKDKPYICDFSELKNVNEKKASRFAAELLYPELALRKDVDEYCRELRVGHFCEMSFNQIAVFIMMMTVKYEMPLKAVIYRLFEEKYINSIDEYIDNYQFIKKVLQQVSIYDKKIEELYGTSNIYVQSFSDIYKNMEITYLLGNATKEDILRDSKFLDLKEELIFDILTDEDDANEEIDDDDELIAIIKSRKA